MTADARNTPWNTRNSLARPRSIPLLDVVSQGVKRGDETAVDAQQARLITFGELYEAISCILFAINNCVTGIRAGTFLKHQPDRNCFLSARIYDSYLSRLAKQCRLKVNIMEVRA